MNDIWKNQLDHFFFYNKQNRIQNNKGKVTKQENIGNHFTRAIKKKKNSLSFVFVQCKEISIDF